MYNLAFPHQERHLRFILYINPRKPNPILGVVKVSRKVGGIENEINMI